MGPRIEIDPETYTSLKLAADLQGLTVGEVVRQLVDRLSGRASSRGHEPTRGEGAGSGDPATPASDEVSCFMDYDGVRTHAIFDVATESLTITSGPLKDKRYRSPSGAATAVVQEANPAVSPNRNGWSTWIIGDDGRLLQAIRR